MLKNPNKCENKICCTSKFIEYKYLPEIENYENLSLWVRKVFNWSGLKYKIMKISFCGRAGMH